MDLSSPEGFSVNDGIREELCTLTYVSVDDAARAVVEKGRGAGALLAKADIRSAYRIVPVHPEDMWLLGIMWEGALYTPKIYNVIAEALEWVA